jgi:hypothetical protein
MVTLLYLNTADKALIMYLYVCFAIWVLHSVYKSDKAKSKAKSYPNSKDIIPVVIKPTNNIQTNIFVSVRIWINGIEKRKLITDDDIDSPGDKEGRSLPIPIKKYELNSSKIEFVRAVIRWCLQNLDENKKRVIHLNLKYTKHKTLMGSYSYYNKTITIYFGSHKSIESLVDTIIHEHDHTKVITCKKHQAEYDKLTKEKTYYLNPYETRARKAGADYRLKCILDLYKLNYLK